MSNASTIDLLRQALACLNPTELDIIDDSHLHAGHEGAKSGGGHYQVIIKAEIFRGLSTLARHRIVYDSVGSLMQGSVHALVIRALTPD